MEAQQYVKSCLFWRIGPIRPSAADDSETNKHQTSLHNSLCCIAPWRGDLSGEERRRRGARHAAGLAGRRLDPSSDSSLSRWRVLSGCNDTLISGKHVSPPGEPSRSCCQRQNGAHLGPGGRSRVRTPETLLVQVHHPRKTLCLKGQLALWTSVCHGTN